MARSLPMLLVLAALVVTGCGPQPQAGPADIAGPSLDEKIPETGTLTTRSDDLEDGGDVAPAPSANEIAAVPEVLAYDGDGADDGEDTPDLNGASGGLFGGFKGFGNLGDISKKIQEGVQKKVVQSDPEVMSAIDRMTIMLGPDRLGGQDGTFNQNDIPAIRQRLLQTPEVRQQMAQGISQELNRRLPPRLASRWGAGRGLIGPAVQNKAWSEATNQAWGQITSQLNDGMNSEFVSPAGPYQPDMTPRTGLTYPDLDQFQRDAKTIQAFGQKWNKDLVLPNGPSVQSMQQMANGQTPPGAVSRADAQATFPQRMASAGLSAPNTYGGTQAVPSCGYGTGGTTYGSGTNSGYRSSPSPSRSNYAGVSKPTYASTRNTSSGSTRRGVFGGGGLFRRR